VRPWARLTEDGDERIFAALESTVPNREQLVANTELASNMLEIRDGLRSYTLLEDLALNGQQEPGMYVPQYYRLEDPPLEEAGNNPGLPDGYWGWMAVRGNNRNKRRQELYEISSAEVLTGVPYKKLGEDHRDGIAVNPNYWLRALSHQLNREYTEARNGKNLVVRALRARQVAEVTAHLVIGSPTPHRLFNIVQSSNRRDHVHPPLDFAPNDRARALGRNVLSAYVAAGVLDEKIADVLAGAAPINELPGVPEGASISTMRDARSMRLLAELFPVDEVKRKLVRRALSEVAPSDLRLADINRRARAWSALTSQSYPNPWNPRVAEVFQRDARNGFTYSGRLLTELLETADTDDDAFEELITFRAPHWLAAFDLIDADRGSLSGQKIDDDDGVKADRVRRSVKNSLNALRKNRPVAVGLLRELAAAMDEGDRDPRRILESGEPDNKEASRAWFNRSFPKETGSRSYHRVRPEAAHEDVEAQPVQETPTQAVDRMIQSVDACIRDLTEGARNLSSSLGQLVESAQEAGLEHALPQQRADEFTLAITRTMGRLRTIPEMLAGMSDPD
jgi:hypothetical protein